MKCTKIKCIQPIPDLQYLFFWQESKVGLSIKIHPKFRFCSPAHRWTLSVWFICRTGSGMGTSSSMARGWKRREEEHRKASLFSVCTISFFYRFKLDGERRRRSFREPRARKRAKRENEKRTRGSFSTTVTSSFRFFKDTEGRRERHAQSVGTRLTSMLWRCWLQVFLTTQFVEKFCARK